MNKDQSSDMANKNSGDKNAMGGPVSGNDVRSGKLSPSQDESKDTKTTKND